MTLELNFCFDKAGTLPLKILQIGSVKFGSARSTKVVSRVSHESMGQIKNKAWELTDVLNNIVSKWILHESEGIRSDISNEFGTLIARSMVDAAL